MCNYTRTRVGKNRTLLVEREEKIQFQTKANDVVSKAL